MGTGRKRLRQEKPQKLGSPLDGHSKQQINFESDKVDGKVRTQGFSPTSTRDPGHTPGTPHKHYTKRGGGGR